MIYKTEAVTYPFNFVLQILSESARCPWHTSDNSQLQKKIQRQLNFFFLNRLKIPF